MCFTFCVERCNLKGIISRITNLGVIWSGSRFEFVDPLLYFRLQELLVIYIHLHFADNCWFQVRLWIWGIRLQTDIFQRYRILDNQIAIHLKKLSYLPQIWIRPTIAITCCQSSFIFEFVKRLLLVRMEVKNQSILFFIETRNFFFKCVGDKGE